jgi:bifunctional isochorismate lyase/aryl carrier protein
MKFSLDPTATATLVVDMQRLFTAADGPFENAAAGRLIDPINRLAANSRALGIPVVHSAYVLADDGSDAGLLAGGAEVAAGHFAASSPWTAWDPRLDQDGEDLYHARCRPGAFWGGTLDVLLERLGKNQLILCGLSINNALSTTAREAFARDIPVFLVRDASGAAPFETHLDVYFEALDTWTCEVVSLTDVLERMGGAQ